MSTGSKIFVFQCEPYVSEKEIEELISKVQASPEFQKHAFYLALPYTSLSQLSAKINTPQILFGAAGVNSIAEGAFTQKVAISLLKEAGAKFVMIGSSFYRHLYEETNATINLKLKAALEGGLIPVFCVGERKEQNDAEKLLEILKSQVKEGLDGLSSEQLKKIVFLYEASAFIKPNIEVLVKDCEAFRRIVDQIAGSSAVIINAIPRGTRNLDAVVVQVEGGGFYSGDQHLICDLLHIPFHHESPVQDPVASAEDAGTPDEKAPKARKKKKAVDDTLESEETSAVLEPKARATRKKKVAADLEGQEA